MIQYVMYVFVIYSKLHLDLKITDLIQKEKRTINKYNLKDDFKTYYKNCNCVCVCVQGELKKLIKRVESNIYLKSIR